jgi:hypothetical protein
VTLLDRSNAPLLDSKERLRRLEGSVDYALKQHPTQNSALATISSSQQNSAWNSSQSGTQLPAWKTRARSCGRDRNLSVKSSSGLNELKRTKSRANRWQLSSPLFYRAVYGLERLLTPNYPKKSHDILARLMLGGTSLSLQFSRAPRLSSSRRWWRPVFLAFLNRPPSE